MNEPTVPAATAGSRSRPTPLASLGRRWQVLAPRERVAVGAALAALAVLVLWLLALRPALHTLKTAPAELAVLETQLQTMQRLAAEARELRATPPLAAGQAAEALRVATEQLGDKARLTLQGDRATVVLTGVSPGALRDWLSAARAAARVRPIEVNLTHAPTPAGGGWNGNVVLSLGGGA